MGEYLIHPLQALNESELHSLLRVADRLLNTQHLLAAGHRTNRLRAGFGIEFLDFREFAAGDEMRNIDWRSTARSRHPQVRRYSDEAAADWFIALDCSASMAIGEGDKWGLAVQCTAAIAYILLHLGNRVAVLLFSDRIEQMVPLGRGYTHYASILQTLRQAAAHTSGGGSDLSSCVARIKRHSPVFVISDFLTADGMQHGLNALTMRGDRIHALQILSQWDYRVPQESMVRFRDVESAKSVTVNLDDEQRKQFQERLNSFCDAVADYCRKQRIRYSHHLENEPWKSVLVAHLRAGKR